LASSIATRGLCSELFESIIHDHDLLTCEAVISELRRVLRSKLRLPDSVIHGFLEVILTEAELIGSHTPPSVQISDPDDVSIVACAIAGKADVFVTGDKAPLAHGKINGMPVASPRELWSQLAGL
ncbi:MAG: PIN domain-containing protein, partial [Burkholderiales bacterium]